MMKSGITVRGVVYSALFGALLVAMSFLSVSLGFTPVPISLTTMGVMLAGAILGAAYGGFSMLLVIALTFLGLPLIHGEGGLGYMLGPKGGFAVMFPLSAYLIGWFVSRVRGNGKWAFIQIFLMAFVFGSLLIYVTGVPWLAYKANVSIGKALVMGMLPYLPGDVIKALVTAIIVLPVRRAFPVWKLVGGSGSEVVQLQDRTE
ncbi:biotin transporter BioY [Paenibacillus sp. y28]|uniref:biotin transporter BioY n=1 Tax=Paenibacillus sp. y28 TaxID=3129110 RepID=UPI00301A1DE1